MSGITLTFPIAADNGILAAVLPGDVRLSTAGLRSLTPAAGHHARTVGIGGDCF
jgi:hypothetical protein